MPNDAGRAGTPAGVFGAELRFYRTRAGLSQKDLAAGATVSHDVISKIETGERPPAEDFPPRLDAVPELDTPRRADPPAGPPEEGPQAAPVRLVPGMGRHRSPGHGPALVRAARRPGLLQTEEYARAILSAAPTGTRRTQTSRSPPGWPVRPFWTERVRPRSGASSTRASCTAPSAAARSCEASSTAWPKWRSTARRSRVVYAGTGGFSRLIASSSSIAATVVPSVRIVSATAVARARVWGVRAVLSAADRDPVVGAGPSCAMPMPRSATRSAQ